MGTRGLLLNWESTRASPMVPQPLGLVTRLPVEGCKIFLQLCQGPVPMREPILLSGRHLRITRYASEFPLREKKGRNPYVFPVSSASKTASHPKCAVPRAGTIRPSVRPSNRTGSVVGPALYAKVHNAQASLVSNPASILFRPSGDIAQRANVSA